MALKPTIYKMNINLSDLNRDIYDTLNLTLALHPSETAERMMARVVAYCLNAQEFLSFTKGLSCVEEPDIRAKSLDDQQLLWIDMGEPAFERIKKASRQAKQVKIVSFNSKSDVWWKQNQSNFATLSNLEVIQFNFAEIQNLAKLLQRTMDFSVTISENSVYIATASGECEITFTTL